MTPPSRHWEHFDVCGAEECGDTLIAEMLGFTKSLSLNLRISECPDRLQFGELLELASVHHDRFHYIIFIIIRQCGM